MDSLPPSVNRLYAHLWLQAPPTPGGFKSVTPSPARVRCRFSTRFVTAGFLEEDGEVWDSTGRLVGQSRQLALVPRG